jgi:1,2-diacylglycerol 3-alpha-glucosyltransferase
MLSARYFFSGASVVMENLSKSLTLSGHDVSIGAFQFKDMPSIAGVPIVMLGAREVLSRRALAGAFDIIHNHQPSSGFLASLTDVPFLYHYHGAPSQSLSAVHFTNLVLNRLQMRTYDRVISVSESGAYELKRLFNAKKVDVVYNGVDVQRFGGQSAPSLRRGDPQLLFVGTLYGHKHLELLVRATEILAKVYPNIHLSVVGTGPRLNYLENCVRSIGIDRHVTFWGRASEDDLPRHYASCDAYVSPSEWELFDMPLLEAMASGKPVVASSIPVHLELARKSNAIMIFPRGDPGGLCERVSQVLRHPEDLRRNGLDFARQHDWPVVASRITEIYRDVLGARGR